MLKVFTKAYHDRLAHKKVITLCYDESTRKWELVSQYTGAIEPATLKGLITHLKDFRLKERNEKW